MKIINYKKILINYFSLLFLISLFSLVLEAQEYKDGLIDVDVELVLAVDVSSSVDQNEFDLQMLGIASAFRHPDIIAAIGTIGGNGIAVALVQWSDSSEQVLLPYWHLIRNQEESLDFSRKVQYASRQIKGGQTSITGALRFAIKEIESNQFVGLRKIIDISGDGRANNGPHPMETRDIAISKGITINGLAILGEEPFLDQYFEYSVIGGRGSFIMVAEDYSDYSSAIYQKILKELGLPVANIFIKREIYNN